MTYRIPDARTGPVQEILQALDGAERLVLTTHVNADGDGAGSEVALAAWLRARGKPTWIINPTPFPPSLGFLLPDRGWALDAGSNRARDVLAKTDLAVVLDTGEVPRIGPVMELIGDVPTIILDHHPSGPDPIPGLALRDPAASATGELVYDLLSAAGGPWPEESVNGLYVAILADTGSFRFSNTTPAVLRIAASLLEKGADPEELHRQTFGNLPLRKLRLLAASLAELRVDTEAAVAWMTVPTEAFAELDAKADDIEGLVDFPRDIEGVEVALLFRETAKGATKISFRANRDVDVNALARRFGGGGHVKASGALVEKPLPEAREEVLAATRAAVATAAADSESVRGREEDDGG